MSADVGLEEVTLDALEKVAGGEFDPSEQRMNNALAAFMEKIKDDPDHWNRLNSKRRGRPF